MLQQHKNARHMRSKLDSRWATCFYATLASKDNLKRRNSQRSFPAGRQKLFPVTLSIFSQRPISSRRLPGLVGILSAIGLMIVAVPIAAQTNLGGVVVRWGDVDWNP